MLRVSIGSGCCGAALLVASLGIFSSASLAQDSRPHVVITSPQEVKFPVIPQGNYLDPGPGAPIRPDVANARGPNDDYAFPPNFNAGYVEGPPGDPTVDGQWDPLPGVGNLPSF